MKKPTLTTKLKSLFDPYLWTGSDLLTILVLFQFDRGVGQAHLKGCIPPLGRQPQAFEQTLKIDRKERPSKRHFQLFTESSFLGMMCIQ